MDPTRKHDMAQLREEYARTKDRDEKERIERTAHNIRNETGKIRSMREALLKAHRNGDKGEIKDIHEFIKNKRQYRNE